ncbi:hypothetical protein FISHEDRAFT_59521 [Fistulina hepatica ATCC 64428]|uniref:Transmembrane protein n=1 Tax=Fistulina hepatica ATCC 64428 TaxID=1128425 RepID=A0A0D7AB78_9AGAR|nr:hypothetical protein FISHEDRAFT_59521 [Fistulina hepatica ATCC 64428]
MSSFCSTAPPVMLIANHSIFGMAFALSFALQSSGYCSSPPCSTERKTDPYRIVGGIVATVVALVALVAIWIIIIRRRRHDRATADLLDNACQLPQMQYPLNVYPVYRSGSLQNRIPMVPRTLRRQTSPSNPVHPRNSTSHQRPEASHNAVVTASNSQLLSPAAVPPADISASPPPYVKDAVSSSALTSATHF